MQDIMSKDFILSIADFAMKAWQAALDAVRAMPMIGGVALVFSVVLSGGLLAVRAALGPNIGFGGELLETLLAVVASFLLAPFAIAMQRHVLLGKVAERYVSSWTDPRLFRFFAAILVIYVLPTKALALLSFAAGGIIGSIASLLMVLIVIAAVLTWLLTVIFFPAIAIEVPDPDWRNAMRDMWDHFAWALLAFFATSLPLSLLYMALELSLLLPPTPTPAGATVAVLVDAAFNVLAIAVLATAAALLYLALANRLGRPPRLNARVTLAARMRSAS
jgi:hypothetical protein